MPAIVLPILPHGPVLSTAIAVSVPRLNALTTAGQQAPAPVMGTFLIDTGASHTSVDKQLIAQLGIPATGLIPMHTPSTGKTPQQCNQFDVAFIIPGPAGGSHFFIDAISIIEADFSQQAIQGLIGRDILARCHLTYIGTVNQYVLSF